ncbi:hypothetical protein OF83DRAFT_1148715 [Amylostereum chailletii]|nr:hypothetical protein OF83DRAFT_1148715 [Amylostereum chailletii]
MSIYPCRWDWCRQTFSVSSERTLHVIQDHIAVATPVRWKEHLRLIRLEEEEMSGTTNSLPTLPDTQLSSERSPQPTTRLADPIVPSPTTARPHTPSRQTAAFSDLSAHSSPDAIVASQPASPSVDVLIAQGSRPLRRET